MALISPAMNAALNEQIGNEFSTSLQYIALAAHFDCEDLPELAAHFYKQADEEHTHAMRFIRFIVDAGGRVEIPQVPQPQSRFETAHDGVEKAYNGEIEVTRQINALLELAIKESDHITHNTLQWFVTEQLEEVSSMQTLLSIVRRAGENNLLMVEEYLARNVRMTSSPDLGDAA
jgi:ferritin